MTRVCCGVAIAATLATSACAAGQRAQTADQKPTLDGTEASVGQIDLRGLSVDAPTSGPSYPAGASAQVRLVAVNNGHSTDRLVSITSSGITGWASYSSPAAAQQANGTVTGETTSASPAVPQPTATSSVAPTRSIAITAGAATSWGVPSTQRRLVISGLTKRLFAGNTISLTFTFAKAGKVTVPVPVMLTAKPLVSVIPEPKNAGASATG